jgi:translocation and assembly module TamB
MIRGRKIAWIAGGAIAGLIAILIAAGIIIVQTQWFRDYVRAQIVHSVEDATGGRVSVGSFSFDWHQLRAEVRDFVVHGLEPAGAGPLFEARLIEVDFKLLSPLKGFVDIAALLVDTPQANVIVFPDGRTNIPAPRTKSRSNRSGLETIVDLAIGHFDLRDGSITVADRKTNFSADGENLRAQLAWEEARRRYTGEIDMNPLNWRPDSRGPENRQPLRVSVTVPLTLERDRISLANARLASAESQIVLSGSMEHMLRPRFAVRLNARVALDELNRALRLRTPLDTARGPRLVNLDAAAAADAGRFAIQSARLSLGRSDLEASGTLEDGSRPGSLQFRSSLALGELGRLLGVAQQPEGTVVISGNAAFDRNFRYVVRANVDARSVALRQGTTQLTGIGLESALTADPHRIELTGLRLSALGGELAGSASLVDMAQFRLSGNLRNFGIAAAAHVLGGIIAYNGMVSGPFQAEGNIKTSTGLVARANLAIAPAPRERGIPVSGRLIADYNGQAQTVTLGQSFVALPHSRVDLSGPLGREIQVRMVSRDLADFQPLAAIPVTFQNGNATLNATVSGSFSAPRIAGHMALTNFAVEGRSFTRFGADVSAASSGVTVSNATLARGNFLAQFAAAVGLRNWKPEGSEALKADATVRNGDLQDVLALAGESGVHAAGALTADAHIEGTLGEPRGNAEVTVTGGNFEGASFDRLGARAAFTPGAIEIPAVELVAGPSQLQANATYQHAPNELERGSLRAHLASSQVQLADIPALVKDRPGLRGVVSVNGDLAANVAPAATPGNKAEFQIVSLDANLSARALEMAGHNLGNFTAVANTAGNAIQYNVTSDFAGSTIRVAGQSLLTGDHQTTASGSIANLPVEQVLAVAGRRDLPVSGVVTANAQVSGTLNNPQATASFTINKGSAYQERFDRLQANVNYTGQLIDVPSFHLTAGPSDLDLSASFAHPAGDLEDGQVRFRVRSNSLELARFHTVEQFKPGLAGTLEMTADGAATLRRNQAPLFSTFDANLSARGLSVDKRRLGDVTATAETRGSAISFNLKSDFAHSAITGDGRMEVGGDYPLNAKVRFTNLTYSGLSAWTGGAPPGGLDASTDGEIDISGPAARVEDLRGSLELAKLEAHMMPPQARTKPRVNFNLHNEGPVTIALDRSVVTVQNAHITGTDTDLALNGTAALSGARAVNLRANGNVKLEVLEAFGPDIFSSGSVVLNAAVTGTTAKPAINGRLELQNASFHLLDAPNGISDAKGAIVFTGSEAVVQNITGESGGGKVTLAGFVAYGGPQAQFRLQATADRVHVAYPENVTTEADARLTLTGNPARSVLSGNVTVLNVALASQTDIGSLLGLASKPPTAPAANTGLLGGMTFDVRIQTSPGVQFRTSIAQNLQADANLTLRGTIDNPGMLGRISINQGEVVFFSNKYTINQGSITFFDPNRVNPTLNMELETSAQGVDVTLTVSGPLDRLKLSYRSDPPLRFDEIVALLATGAPPTTDPVLAAYQPAAPQQSLQQQGLSALLGQSVANPVAGNLQRLFGVTSVSINPLIAGTTNTPQATLTVQQRITQDITFTYQQDTAAANPLTIRMEWAIDSRWSVVAQRDIYGELDLNFYYKRRFH